MAEDEKRLEEDEEDADDEEGGVLDQILGHISDEEMEEAVEEPPSQGPASHGSDVARKLRPHNAESAPQQLDRSNTEKEMTGEERAYREDQTNSMREAIDAPQTAGDGNLPTIGGQNDNAPELGGHHQQDSETAADQSKDSKAKFEHRVFVTGISGGGEWLDRMALQKHFGKFGTVLDVFIPRTRRVAYVSFDDAQVVEDVLALETMRIDKCWLRLIRAEPRPADPVAAAVAAAAERGNRTPRADPPFRGDTANFPVRTDGARGNLPPHMPGGGPPPHMMPERRDVSRPNEEHFRDAMMPRDVGPPLRGVPDGGPPRADRPMFRDNRDDRGPPFRGPGADAPFPRADQPFRGEHWDGPRPAQQDGPYRGEHRDPAPLPREVGRGGQFDAPFRGEHRDGFRDPPRVDGPFRGEHWDGPRPGGQEGPYRGVHRDAVPPRDAGWSGQLDAPFRGEHRGAREVAHGELDPQFRGEHREVRDVARGGGGQFEGPRAEQQDAGRSGQLQLFRGGDMPLTAEHLNARDVPLGGQLAGLTRDDRDTQRPVHREPPRDVRETNRDAQREPPRDGGAHGGPPNGARDFHDRIRSSPHQAPHAHPDVPRMAPLAAGGGMDRVTMERGGMDRDILDRGGMDRGMTDRGVTDRGVVDRGGMDRREPAAVPPFRTDVRVDDKDRIGRHAHDDRPIAVDARQHERGAGKREREREQPSEQPTGVGMVLDHPDETSYGACRVKEIKPAGPVGQSGVVQVGDMLLSVNAFNCVGVSRDVIKGHVLGPPGSPIDLEFQRGSAPPFVIKILRSAAPPGRAPPAAAPAMDSRFNAAQGQGNFPDSKRPRMGEVAPQFERPRDDWGSSRGQPGNGGGFGPGPEEKLDSEWASPQAGGRGHVPQRASTSNRLGNVRGNGGMDQDGFVDHGGGGDPSLRIHPGNNNQGGQGPGGARGGQGRDGEQWDRDGAQGNTGQRIVNTGQQPAREMGGGFTPNQKGGLGGGWGNDSGQFTGGQAPGWNRDRSQSPPVARQVVPVQPPRKDMRHMEHRLFVTGTAGGHAWLNQDVLRNAVSRFGQVLQVVIPRDRKFAFVSFENRNSVEAALQVGDATIEGCTVKFLRAKQHQPQQAQ